MGKGISVEELVELCGNDTSVEEYMLDSFKIETYSDLEFPIGAVRFGLFGAALDHGKIKLSEDEQTELKEKAEGLGATLADFSDKIIIADGGCPEFALCTIAGETAKKIDKYIIG